jgi:hypothetical protein
MPSHATDPSAPRPSSWLLVALAWTLVGIPLAWGIYRTLRTAVKIF